MSRLSQLLYRLQNKQRGFTLIELMIVVAVIAVLTLIAYPNYISSVRKGKRGQAKADLVQVVQSMERCYTQLNTYTGCWAGTDVLTAPSNQSPTNGPKIYDLVLAVPTAQTFSVTATATGDQLKDSCGALTINQANVKTYTGSGTNCW